MKRKGKEAKQDVQILRYYVTWESSDHPSSKQHQHTVKLFFNYIFKLFRQDADVNTWKTVYISRLETGQT